MPLSATHYVKFPNGFFYRSLHEFSGAERGLIWENAKVLKPFCTVYQADHMPDKMLVFAETSVLAVLCKSKFKKK